jgi:NADH dehydrogenase/NADH:ubiquinone oxidoreductase subunit G
MSKQVTVKVNDSVEIICNKNDNLLRILEKNGYEIDYERQGSIFF